MKPYSVALTQLGRQPSKSRSERSLAVGAARLPTMTVMMTTSALKENFMVDV